jgi:predicted PurR-regulated permease PerM
VLVPAGVATLLTLALVVGALYFAKEILLPVALAVLLSFVLAPLVTRLERWRLRRTLAVIVVTAVSFSAIGGVGWLAMKQIVELSAALPQHKDNLIAKIRSLRGAGAKLQKAKEALEDIGDELADGGSDEKQPSPPTGELLSRWFPWNTARTESPSDDEQAAVAVKVVELPLSPLGQVAVWLGPLVGPLSTAGIVIVLVVFMLLKREDLRNRMIQLFGTSRLYATTEAIDDATQRLSRYLQMQLLINFIYGLVMAGGLALIGVPNALLWGVFGMLLRFLPYLGPWIAAAMPITLSLAISEGWTQPLLTIGLFLVLELVVNNVLEPWLYGSSAGVSSFGVILAALFWTWLWGPIGLVLAMPLTVCLVVLGKYSPQLAFLPVLLGDRSTLQPHEHLYQRLLASSDVEASKLVDEQLRQSSLTEVYDEVLVPALNLAERDRHAGLLSDQQASDVIESARELIAELSQQHAASLESPDTGKQGTPRAMCVPVRDQADELAAMMLGHVLSVEGCMVEVGSLDLLASEAVQRIEEYQCHAAVLAALPPVESGSVRYLCKRLRRHDAELPVIVAFLGGEGQKKAHRRFLDSGATTVATSLPEVLVAVRQASARAAQSRAPLV